MEIKMSELHVILTIAHRDLLKFLRDKQRIIFSLIFPFIFIAALGGSLNANLEQDVGYNFLTFIFVGILAQSLFQSTASGVISLIEDRENDFSQEIFVSPISRYSIIAGKILGESLVAMAQIVAIFVIGIIIRVPLDLYRLLMLVPFGLIVCLLGGAFGVLILANLNSQRSANQIFPFIMFPQFFLAGVFSPIKNLPFYLLVLSRISPMTYAVDLLRSIYYAGKPEYDKIVIYSYWYNLALIIVMITVFITLGTYLFIKNERNR
jgi:ABC-2 type transport system permease protein